MLLRPDLLTWQKLNVTAFLISAIATSEPDLTGEPYLDHDGNTYLPMLRQPVLVFAATSEQLAIARTKAVDRALHVAVYTHDLFTTGHDHANRGAIASVRAADLDLVGISVRGPRNAIDRITKRLPLHD